MLPRPQPIGVLPFPAGLLLLPRTEDPGAQEARAALMRGGIPERLPDEWHCVALASGGERDEALALLDGARDPVADYNRYVLAGDVDALARARDAGDDTLTALCDVAAYIQGARDDPPDGAALDGEFAAHALLARAAWHLEREDDAGAIQRLAAGVDAARAASPILAAQLQSQRAQLLPPGEERIAAWRDAVQLAKGTPLLQLAADLALGLALALHESAETSRARLVEAIQWYQTALHEGITLEARAETFALVQNNLGLAYIATPMAAASDALRLAVAVQSFREALKVYTADAYPEQWSSALLNMANALQYLPSSHQQENLVEAVNAYETLLAVRNKALDPVGYARLLANQANALAHLGVFTPALDKLNEARKLLSWHGEDDAAAALLEQVERINAQLAATAGSAAATAGSAAATDGQGS